MAGVSFIILWSLGFFLIGISENLLLHFFTIYKYKSNIIFFSKLSTLSGKFDKVSTTSFILLFYCLYFLTLKSYYIAYSVLYNFYNIYFLITIIFFFFFKSIWVKISNIFSLNYEYIYMLLLTLLFTLSYAKNILYLFLVLESIAAIYYFFFLKYVSYSQETFIKYKNLLSLYLWLSFFTLIFIIFALMTIVYLYGTIDLIELNSLNFKKGSNILLFALFIKIGMPGFHFLKLEIYKFLNLYEVIFFSMLTLVVNTLFIVNIFYFINIFIKENFTIIYISLIFNIILLLQGLEGINFNLFLAISSFTTIITFIIILMNKCYIKIYIYIVLID